jgi:hypothetical protein
MLSAVEATTVCRSGSLGESDSLFAAEAQQIEHEDDDEDERDSPKLGHLGLIIFI